MREVFLNDSKPGRKLVRFLARLFCQSNNTPLHFRGRPNRTSRKRQKLERRNCGGNR